jgi:hypothetical protein
MTDGVSCNHQNIRITHPDQFNCADCRVALPDPRGCRHPRIDNATEQCVACGEKMLHPPVQELVTAMSAPNKAACTNPDCSGDVDDPNCGDAGAVYVPDRAQEREVPIRWDVTYRCERCQYDGTVFASSEPPLWECGRDHRGDSIPIREGAIA